MEVIVMTAKAHDRIVVESEKVGLPAREGDVLEVIEASYGTRYRVAWDDGHESTFRPTAGSARIVPASKTPAKRK
jgi:hypothetical protein